MRVPILDLKPQIAALGPAIKDAVCEVIDSGRWVLGPRVEELEAELAKYAGTRFAVGVSSGTDALLAALMAYDVGPGDLVITPVYSFFATAGVVARLKATPVFIDCDPTTYNIDAAALSRWFDEHADQAAQVKAIIPVHLYGQCADMDAINAIACAHEVPVIEDAAQAIGASYPGQDGVKRAGSIGAVGCLSFYPTKNLGAIGDAGALTTNDEHLAEKLRRLRLHGECERYRHLMVGGNFRIDPIQAVALSIKFPHLEQWHQMRRDNAARYDAGLSVDGLRKPKAVYGREHHIYNQYIITVPERRDELRRYLGEHEIGSGVYYPIPFHQQDCFQYLGYKAGGFPNAERAAQNSVALPIYPELTEPMLDFVIEKINAFYQ